MEFITFTKILFRGTRCSNGGNISTSQLAKQQLQCITVRINCLLLTFTTVYGLLFFSVLLILQMFHQPFASMANRLAENNRSFVPFSWWNNSIDFFNC